MSSKLSHLRVLSLAFFALLCVRLSLSVNRPSEANHSTFTTLSDLESTAQVLLNQSIATLMPEEAINSTDAAENGGKTEVWEEMESTTVAGPTTVIKNVTYVTEMGIMESNQSTTSAASVMGTSSGSKVNQPMARKPILDQTTPGTERLMETTSTPKPIQPTSASSSSAPSSATNASQTSFATFPMSSTQSVQPTVPLNTSPSPGPGPGHANQALSSTAATLTTRVDDLNTRGSLYYTTTKEDNHISIQTTTASSSPSSGAVNDSYSGTITFSPEKAAKESELPLLSSNGPLNGQTTQSPPTPETDNGNSACSLDGEIQCQDFPPLNCFGFGSIDCTLMQSLASGLFEAHKDQSLPVNVTGFQQLAHKEALIAPPSETYFPRCRLEPTLRCEPIPTLKDCRGRAMCRRSATNSGGVLNNWEVAIIGGFTAAGGVILIAVLMMYISWAKLKIRPEPHLNGCNGSTNTRV